MLTLGQARKAYPYNLCTPSGTAMRLLRPLLFILTGLSCYLGQAQEPPKKPMLPAPDPAIRIWTAPGDSVPRLTFDRMPILKPDLAKLAKMPVLKIDSLSRFPMPQYRFPKPGPNGLEKGGRFPRPRQ